MRKNQYGFKVGYQDKDSRLFIKQFITRSHKHAYRMLLFYRKYGHDGCKKKEIERFNYRIKPITQREILSGIWDINPFDALFKLFLPPA